MTKFQRVALRLIRVFNIRSIGRAGDILFARALDDLLVVKEIAEEQVPTASLDDDLSSVLRLLTEYELDALPVVGDEARFIGMVRRRDVFGSYYAKLAAMKRIADES